MSDRPKCVRCCTEAIRWGNKLENEVRHLRAEVRRLRKALNTPRTDGEWQVCRYCGAGVPLDSDSRRIRHHPGCLAVDALRRQRAKGGGRKP